VSVSEKIYTVDAIQKLPRSKMSTVVAESPTNWFT